MATQQQKPAPFGARSFFDPNQGALQPTPDQNQPQNLQPNTALPAANDSSSAPQMASNSGAAALPSMTPPATAPAGSAPATSNSPGTSTDDGANYFFHQVSPTAFLPARPVSPLDEVHGVRRGFAMALAGLGDFGSRLTGRNDSLLQDWNKEHMAQVQYDRNQPQMSARAQMQSDQSNLANQGAAAGVAHTQAETRALDPNNPNNLPALQRKQSFMAQLQQEAESGKYDPQSLKAKYLRMAQYNRVPASPDEIDSVIQNTKPLGPDFTVIKGEGGRPEALQDRAGNQYTADQIKSSLANNPAAQTLWNAAQAGHQQERTEKKEDQAAAMAAGMARAQAFSNNRVVEVVDPNNPGAVHYERAGEAIASGGTAPASVGFQTQKAVAKDFTSGGASKTLNAFNTATEHLQQLSSLSDALHNGDVQGLNSLANKFATATGSAAPTNFDMVKNAVAGEIAKVFKGNATEGEISAINSTINNAMSPAQLKGAIAQATQLMASKRSALQQQYQQGMQGKPAFEPTSPNGNSQQQWEHTATGPNGHKIGSRGGKWFDIQTGQPLQ